MDRLAKRILIGSGIAAAGMGAAGAANRAITKYFVDVALNREPPPHPSGSERLLSGFAMAPEFLQAVADAGEKLAGREGEVVRICSRDGTVLVGHWFGCQGAERIILAMHGWRSNWHDDFGLVANFWFQSRCNVLFAEQRGQGESGGDYMGFGLLERFDCQDWVDWIIHKENSLPIYLAGVSMGASTVLMAAGMGLPNQVKGVMADCGFTSPVDIWTHVAKDNLGLGSDSRMAAADSICRKKIRMGIGDYSCVEAMGTCRVPVLFIHGTDDHFVPIRMTYENYKACVAPKRLFVVPGADHGMSYLVDTEGYEGTVRKFWKDCDK